METSTLKQALKQYEDKLTTFHLYNPENYSLVNYNKLMRKLLNKDLIINTSKNHTPALRTSNRYIYPQFILKDQILITFFSNTTATDILVELYPLEK